MTVCPVYSPLYVVPPPAKSTVNVASTLHQCKYGIPEPLRVPKPTVVAAEGRSWLDAYPFEGVDIYEAVFALAIAEPLKVLGTLGGGLAVTGCHQKQIVPAPLCIEDATALGPPLIESNESASSAPEDAMKKGKKNRFCKGKRDRYRKLVERLIKEAKVCPDTFTLEAVQLPHAIVSNEVSKAKLLATVLNFARHPDRDDN